MPSRALAGITHLVEVDVQTVELLVGSTLVNTAAVKAVLARDGLPISMNEYAVRQDAWSRGFFAVFSKEKRTRRQNQLGYPAQIVSIAMSRFVRGGSAPRRGKSKRVEYLHTDRSGGEPARRRKVICQFVFTSKGYGHK